jgi:hypothetical protein
LEATREAARFRFCNGLRVFKETGDVLLIRHAAGLLLTRYHLPRL